MEIPNAPDHHQKLFHKYSLHFPPVLLFCLSEPVITMTSPANIAIVKITYISGYTYSKLYCVI